jgi:hypothetical protein
MAEKNKAIVLDFAKTAELDKPVEGGPYHVLIKSFEYKDSRTSQYGYFAVRGEITDGPFAGRALFVNLTTNPEESKNGTPKNFMLYRFLKVLDLVNSESTTLSIDPNEILNQVMVWTVKVNEDNTNDVTSFAKES